MEEEKLQFPAEGATMSFIPKPIGGNSFDIEYSTDDGKTYSKTAPDWIKIDCCEQIVNSVLPHISITVQPQKATITKTATGAGWAYEKGTKEKPYNLSNSKGADEIENTANCYIVNGPGWYRLPLVYGNAIKDGKANTAAYECPTGTIMNTEIRENGGKSSNVTFYGNGTFVNYEGKTITQPYIEYVSARGSLVWEDVKDLITGLSVSGSGEDAFLNFRIAPETFDHGNAVIAIKDYSGRIIWSWHIWVTDYKSGEGDVTYEMGHQSKGNKWEFMPINLGWITERKGTVTTTEKYAARKCKIRISVISSDGYIVQTYIKEISQHCQKLKSTTTEVAYGVGQNNNVYYQWGCKDPFPGCSGSYTNTNKITYGEVSDTNPEAGVDVVKYCPCEYKAQYNVFDAWRTGLPTRYEGRFFDYEERIEDEETDETVLYGSGKTIYDPSPVGYCVLNGFLADRIWGYHRDGKDVKITDNGCITSFGLFLPACGIRSGGNDLTHVGVWGGYWADMPADDKEQTAIGLIVKTKPDKYERGIEYQDNIYRKTACAIRATKEV